MEITFRSKFDIGDMAYILMPCHSADGYRYFKPKIMYCKIKNIDLHAVPSGSSTRFIFRYDVIITKVVDLYIGEEDYLTDFECKLLTGIYENDLLTINELHERAKHAKEAFEVAKFMYGSQSEDALEGMKKSRGRKKNK